MGTFKTTKTIVAPTTFIPGIANEIEQTFLLEGYSVDKQSLSLGAYDISLAKGGAFKAVVGLKTALKVKITPNGDNITIEAGVGLFGQQVVPTLVVLYIAWPVLITQIWGMVKQSKLDEKVINIAMQYVAQQEKQSENHNFTSNKYCPQCGTAILDLDNYCHRCGAKLEKNERL